MERSGRQLPKAAQKSRKMPTDLSVIDSGDVKVVADLSEGEFHDGEGQAADVGLKREWRWAAQEVCRRREEETGQ